MFKLPNTVTSLYFCGDLHWAPNIIKNFIKSYSIVNSCIICCGDFGIGFSPKMEKIELDRLNKFCKLRNIYILILRGNHEDSKYFNNQLINMQFIKCIPDYSIVNVLNKNILCIGGAISVDRMIRKQTDSINIVKYMKYHNCDYKTAELNCPKTYWETEPVIYKPKVEEHIDIICSHSAPSFCYPVGKGKIVEDFAVYDPTLLDDISEERATLDKVYEDYKGSITNWYYGHFHQSNSQFINKTLFKLLNIGEICRYYASSDNNNIL